MLSSFKPSFHFDRFLNFFFQDKIEYPQCNESIRDIQSKIQNNKDLTSNQLKNIKLIAEKLYKIELDLKKNGKRLATKDDMTNLFYINTEYNNQKRYKTFFEKIFFTHKLNKILESLIFIKYMSLDHIGRGLYTRTEDHFKYKKGENYNFQFHQYYEHNCGIYVASFDSGWFNRYFEKSFATISIKLPLGDKKQAKFYNNEFIVGTIYIDKFYDFPNLKID